MLDRRSFLQALTAAGALASAPTAWAADKAPFSPKAFETAQQAGRPILIEITASWCPTCKAQKPILSEITAEPKFKDLAVFEVDFDSQKSVVRQFGAQMQSTLICFKGGAEVARSVGDTKAVSIAALLDKAV